MTTLDLNPFTSLDFRASVEAHLDILAETSRKNGDDAWANAFDKAAYHLATGLMPVFSNGALLIPSGTRAGRVYRLKEGHACPCEAVGACWHSALDEATAYAMGQQPAGLSVEDVEAPDTHTPVTMAGGVTGWRKSPSRISVGQHLTDDPNGAVYRSLTLAAPETVQIAPNRGVVTRERAEAEAGDLFAD